MASSRALVLNFIILSLAFAVALTQEDITRPTFPDVFQVEVTGIFQDESAEMDGALYYDKPNNRAVLVYTFQGDTTTSIYNFNDNQLIYIEGVECSVSDIKDESGTFFPYITDKKTKKKTIAPPESIFYFTKSVFDRQELSIFPSYIFTAKLDIPEYGLKNCEITHMFTKPEVMIPDCDSHNCRSTLVSISVKCPPPTKEDSEIIHIYNFFRFRSVISDEGIFQPPVGVHCDISNKTPFPEFPLYFSFSYDLIDEQKDSGVTSGVYTFHKKVWYDAKLRLIRMDEFDEGGLLSSSRIFDFFGGTAYTIISSMALCETGDLDEDVGLDTMTRLPKIVFTKDPEDRKKAAYVGMRSVHGLHYDVWTLSTEDPETEAKVVQEFYFTNNIREGKESEKNYLQISHVDIYIYQKDDSTGLFELSLLTHTPINNFRSKPKEWESFDVSSCFEGEQKKGFSLKVEGPPIIEHSLLHEQLLEKLYMKLIIATNVSIIRISQLKGTFDGTHVTEFSGWILNKVLTEGSTKSKTEPDIEETFRLIEEGAAAGLLSVTVKTDDKNNFFDITEVAERNITTIITGNITTIITERNITTTILINTDCGSCISGGTVAAIGIFLLLIGLILGFLAYYLYLKKRNPQRSDKINLEYVN